MNSRFVPASDTRAAIVTFQFEGELTQIDSPLEETFSTGDSFMGNYTFDSDVPTTGGDPIFFEDVISAMSFSSGSFSASGTNGDILEDDDQFPFYQASGPVSGSRVGGFLPVGMGLTWLRSRDTNFGVPPGEAILTSNNGTITYPLYDPNLIDDPEFVQSGDPEDLDLHGKFSLGF